MVLVSHASAAQPERPVHVGTGAPPRCRLAPSTSKLRPLATRAFRRQTLEVRTGCPTWARPGLCGGRRAITVPTAITPPPGAQCFGRPSNLSGTIAAIASLCSGETRVWRWRLAIANLERRLGAVSRDCRRRVADRALCPTKTQERQTFLDCVQQVVSRALHSATWPQKLALDGNKLPPLSPSMAHRIRCRSALALNE